MKYSQPKTSSRSIVHQFSKDKGCHYIGGKKWDNIDMSFREVKTNSENRSFDFTIRYGNPEEREWQLNSFSMNEDEIKQFIDVVCDTVYNSPKFKDKYSVGDKFIISNISAVESKSTYIKETNYTNVEATISSIYNTNTFYTDGKEKYYTLCFDGNSIIVKECYLDKLKRVL